MYINFRRQKFVHFKCGFTKQFSDRSASQHTGGPEFYRKQEWQRRDGYVAEMRMDRGRIKGNKGKAKKDERRRKGERELRRKEEIRKTSLESQYGWNKFQITSYSLISMCLCTHHTQTYTHADICRHLDIDTYKFEYIPTITAF